MNKTVKIIIGSVLTLGAVACVVKLAMILYEPKPTLTATRSTTPETSATTEETPYTAPDESKAVIPTYSSKTTTESSSDVYVCPVDFEYLQSVNDDIYAWIYCEGTDIDYPVVQSPNDDEFYLTYNSDGEYSSAGAIFTEHEYNSTDFTDPVTVIYGHHMSSGAMFGNMQEQFTDDEFWDSNPVIEIYLPDKVLKYQVFAAVPYGHYHILHYHDFSGEWAYEDFFEDIMDTHSMEARFHEEFAPEYCDRVIILSTCLIGNNYNRFTVMSKLIYDSSEVK